MPFFFVAATCLLFCGCGDLGGDPILSDAHFSRTFRYYYEQECLVDGDWFHDCSRVEPLSPAYVVHIRIDGFGDATLNLDGHGYYFENGTYDEDWDRHGGYFDFYDAGSGLTIYKDGSEMIIWDLENHVATIYSYEMW
ncbi:MULTISPECIES: hypothetical protein [unclassified Fibrobacter]|uniref:hypothetical protein n=1 Tax=unclassified Fibrobacter TaxID=2634177 RepID=UPI000D79F7CB|nr:MULTISPECIES: hypothetical protein [unclassified Fibrobacter]PWJ64414.1 hypothetical protein BGX12_11515 [Fibrobacter sp. UWR4]PZW69291.1 hypothetical protein C8E88_101415 [Fibrobacter sp. UWR1]